MELIQEFSKLLWDEDVISCILPYINQFVIKNDRNSEQIIALRLFFKLIDRIKYIPKPLANWSVFSVYIIPWANLVLDKSQKPSPSILKIVKIIKILVAKNFFKIINISTLFQVLIHRKAIFE